MARQITSQARVSKALNESAQADDFKDRLVKLIPSEIVTAYVTTLGLISGNDSNGNKDDLLLVIFLLLLVLTPVYLYFVSNVKKVLQIVFTTIAFAIWVSVIGGPFDSLTVFGFPFSFIASILLIVYTLFIPFVYKG